MKISKYVIKVIVVLYTTYNCCFNVFRSYSCMLEAGEAQMCFIVFSRCLIFFITLISIVGIKHCISGKEFMTLFVCLW